MGKIAFSFVFGLILSACIASKFPFRYYTLNADSYDGSLLGPTDSQDVALKMCAPTESNRAPCLVLFTSEFLRLKESYIKCQIDLDRAQRGNP